MTKEHTSTIVKQGLPCSEEGCGKNGTGSSDAVSLYDDGHTHCYSCGKTTPAQSAAGSPQPTQKKSSKGLVQGVAYKELTSRGLTAKFMQYMGYGVANINTKEGKKTVHIANYTDEKGVLRAQKLRNANKKFIWYGESDKVFFFAQHQAGRGGDRIVVTEGEIDAVTVAQITDTKVPCVSLPNGAASARRDFERNYEWLDSFKHIDLFFDNDKAGIVAFESVATMFKPGKVREIRVGLKDANAMLTENRSGELLKAIFSPVVHKPKGVITGNEVSVEQLMKPLPDGIKTAYPKLNAMLEGFRPNEMTIVTAGTGIGKTTFARNLAYDFQSENHKIGMLFLEESIIKTGQGFVALDNSIALPILRKNPAVIPEEQFLKSYKKTMDSDNLVLFNPDSDAFNVETIMAKVRYMALAMHCGIIIVDHLTMVVNGTSEQEMADTNRLVSELATLAKSQEHTAHIILLAQLRKTSGKKSFEEGNQISLDDMKGSGAIKQFAFNVIAIERDQQSEDVDASDTATIRLLKNREWGDTGPCDRIMYNQATGKYDVQDAKPFLAHTPNVMPPVATAGADDF